VTFHDQLAEALHVAEAGALISGRSAAQLWGVQIGPPVVEIWTGSPRLPGLRPTQHHGMDIVDAETALLQVCRYRTSKDIVTACGALRLSVSSLARRAGAWVDAHGPHATHVRELLSALEAHESPDSDLEVRFLHLLDRAGLRRGAVFHHRVRHASGTLELDTAFPAARVGIELDGFAYHGDRASFGRDRQRDVELAAMGWVVLRFTWSHVRRRPEWVIGQIRRTLAVRRPAQGGSLIRD
jgi:very-short-patch-repair endonuclease